MFRSWIRRAWGHAAVFSWSNLVLDRSRKLVGLQSPAACATLAGGDSGPNFKNRDLFHAQAPDTGHGAHARSWRANRDVDVRLLVTWVLFEGAWLFLFFIFIFVSYTELAQRGGSQRVGGSNGLSLISLSSTHISKDTRVQSNQKLA